MSIAVFAVALLVPSFADGPADGEPPPLVESLPGDAGAAGAMDVTALRRSPALRRVLAAAPPAPGGVMPDDLVGRKGPPAVNPLADPATAGVAGFLVAAEGGEERAAAGPGASPLAGPVMLVRRTGPFGPWSVPASGDETEEYRRVLPDGRTAASRHRSAPAAALAGLDEPGAKGGPPAGGPAAALRAAHPDAAALGWLDVTVVRATTLADLRREDGRNEGLSDDDAAFGKETMRALVENVDRAAAALTLVPSDATPGEFDVVLHARAACVSPAGAGAVANTLRALVARGRDAAAGGTPLPPPLTDALRRALESLAVTAEGDAVTATLTVDAAALTTLAGFFPPVD